MIAVCSIPPSPFWHSAADKKGLTNVLDMDASKLHEEYDAYKKENLRAVKEGRGKWSEELATNSESAVGFFFFFFPSSGGR